MNSTTASTTRPARTRRTAVRSLAGVLAAAVLTVTATACQPPPCETDCVSSVQINQGGAQTRIVTTAPAKVHLTIFNDSARKSAVAIKASAGLASTHTLDHTGLTPARDYWYTVKATDESGATWTEQGSFRTFKRTISVKITRIKLIDDSDLAGSGELRFGMRAAGQDFGTVYQNGSMATGDVKNLAITKTIPNTAPSSFRIDIEGVDDDCEGVGSICTGGTKYGYNSGGSNDDADWASTSTATFAVPNTNATANWSATTTKYALKFEISGTWTVSYAA
jgi:hypothetical protein